MDPVKRHSKKDRAQAPATFFNHPSLLLLKNVKTKPSHNSLLSRNNGCRERPGGEQVGYARELRRLRVCRPPRRGLRERRHSTDAGPEEYVAGACAIQSTQQLTAAQAGLQSLLITNASLKISGRSAFSRSQLELRLFIVSIRHLATCARVDDEIARGFHRPSSALHTKS